MRRIHDRKFQFHLHDTTSAPNGDGQESKAQGSNAHMVTVNKYYRVRFEQKVNAPVNELPTNS